MARFYQTSSGSYLEPFDPTDYGYDVDASAKAAASAVDDTLLGSLNVLPQDVNLMDEKIAGYQSKINEYTTQLQSNPNLASELAPEIKQYASTIMTDLRSGDLYNMLLRKQQFDDEVDKIKTVFKDNPAYIRAAISQIEVPPLYDADGNVGKISSRQYYQPWTTETEQNWFKNAMGLTLEKVLKRDIDYKKMPLNDVKTLFYKEVVKGKSKDDIYNILRSQLSDENIRSIAQTGLIIGVPDGLNLTPEEYALQNFDERLKKLALSTAGPTGVTTTSITATDPGSASAGGGGGGRSRNGSGVYIGQRLEAMARLIGESGETEKTDEINNALEGFRGFLQDAYSQYDKTKTEIVEDVIYDAKENKFFIKLSPKKEKGSGEAILPGTVTDQPEGTFEELDMDILRKLLPRTEFEAVYDYLKERGFVSPSDNNTIVIPTTATTTPSPSDFNYGNARIEEGVVTLVYDKPNKNFEDLGYMSNRKSEGGKNVYEYTISEDVYNTLIAKQDESILNPNINAKEIELNEIESTYKESRKILTDNIQKIKEIILNVNENATYGDSSGKSITGKEYKRQLQESLEKEKTQLEDLEKNYSKVKKQFEDKYSENAQQERMQKMADDMWREQSPKLNTAADSTKLEIIIEGTYGVRPNTGNQNNASNFSQSTGNIPVIKDLELYVEGLSKDDLEKPEYKELLNRPKEYQARRQDNGKYNIYRAKN